MLQTLFQKTLCPTILFPGEYNKSPNTIQNAYQQAGTQAGKKPQFSEQKSHANKLSWPRK
jgi:hypothetical protein